MGNTRMFIRENKEIVLLICDFYETKHIPVRMTEVKKNLSLFPVANIPLIEYVLSSLCDQGLVNVILAGRSCEDVMEYVKTVGFAEEMNITAMNCEGNSFGDLMRHIDECGFEFEGLIVIYANHYTNYPLRNVLSKHKEKKDGAVTLLLHPNESNSKVSHLYGLKNGEVMFYDRCVNERYDRRGMLETIEAHKTVEFRANLSSPTIAAISPAVFPLFTENFDFGTLGDLVEGILAFNGYGLKIMYCMQEEEEEKEEFYSREIVTLYDYFKFNEDVRGGRAVDLLRFRCGGKEMLRSFVQVEGNFFLDVPDVEFYEPISNTVIGYDLKFKKKFSIRDSIVGHGCFIEGNIDRCIIWDDVSVQQDFMDHIVFSDGCVVHLSHLEAEVEDAPEENGGRRTSFFDDVLVCLWGAAERDMEKIDMEDIAKQVCLLRILWNASSLDLVEAIGLFLAEMVDVEDVEGSTINASLFFPLLEGHTCEAGEQELLMDILSQGTRERAPDVQREAVLRYGYLLLEDGLISRTVFKSCNAKLKK